MVGPFQPYQSNLQDQDTLLSLRNAGQDIAPQVQIPSLYSDPSQPPQQGPSALGQAVQAGGSLGGVIAQGLFNRAQKRISTQARDVNDLMRKATYQNNLANSFQNEGDIQRQYAMALPAIQGQLDERGVGNSSMMNDSMRNLNAVRDERINALYRQRALMTHGYDAANKLEDLQVKSQKLAFNEQAIAGTIDAVMSMAKIAGI